MDSKSPDPLAVAVVKALHDGQRESLTVLFGSRARGDHRHNSDIDILLVRGTSPDQQSKTDMLLAAQGLSERLYQRQVPVQLVWRTAQEFREQRPNRSGLPARAMDEGVIMPPSSEEFGPERHADYQYDASHDYDVTDQRVRNSENHLTTFQFVAAANMPDESVGAIAHAAVEHALKAVIASRHARYDPSHTINMLRLQVLEVDPDFHHDPPLDGSIYQQYRGQREYCDPVRPLTGIPDYQTLVSEEATTLLNRAKENRYQ